MNVALTNHAIERGKERLGLNPKALQHFADRVVVEGMPWDACQGGMRRWLEAGQYRHHKGSGTRIYGEHVFVIQDNVLVTILELPHEYRGVVKKWRKNADAKKGSQKPFVTARAGRDSRLTADLPQIALKRALKCHPGEGVRL